MNIHPRVGAIDLAVLQVGLDECIFSDRVALSQFRFERLKIDSIKPSGELLRKPALVPYLRECYLRGESVPPIVLNCDLTVVNGEHRLAGAKEARRTHLTCLVSKIDLMPIIEEILSS
jgi:hypothetical protein